MNILKNILELSCPDIIKTAREKSMTYLEERALWDLYAEVQRLERQGIAGELIEADCALGGSAIVISAAKAKHRPLRVFDVFGMIRRRRSGMALTPMSAMRRFEAESRLESAVISTMGIKRI